MFGNWTLLAGVLRVVFAATPDSMGYVGNIKGDPQTLFNSEHYFHFSLYLVTLFSFVLACLHFVVEMTVTLTAPFTFATITPLVISSKETFTKTNNYCHYLCCINTTLILFALLNRFLYFLDADVLV